MTEFRHSPVKAVALAPALHRAWTLLSSHPGPIRVGQYRPHQIEHFAPQQASELYDAEGGLLGLFYRERRQLISLADLPPHVPLAFIAIEDRRFFEHEGVDVRRVVGAYSRYHAMESPEKPWDIPLPETLTLKEK